MSVAKDLGPSRLSRGGEWKLTDVRWNSSHSGGDKHLIAFRRQMNDRRSGQIEILRAEACLYRLAVQHTGIVACGDSGEGDIRCGGAEVENHQDGVVPFGLPVRDDGGPVGRQERRSGAYGSGSVGERGHGMLERDEGADGIGEWTVGGGELPVDGIAVEIIEDGGLCYLLAVIEERHAVEGEVHHGERREVGSHLREIVGAEVIAYIVVVGEIDHAVHRGVVGGVEQVEQPLRLAAEIGDVGARSDGFERGVELPAVVIPESRGVEGGLRYKIRFSEQLDLLAPAVVLQRGDSGLPIGDRDCRRRDIVASEAVYIRRIDPVEHGGGHGIAQCGGVIVQLIDIAVVIGVDDRPVLPYVIVGMGGYPEVIESRMVGHPVEPDGHTQPVRLRHEGLQVGERAVVGVDGGEVPGRIGAAERTYPALHAAGVDRHEPDDVDTQSPQFGQAVLCRREGAGGGEVIEVELVYHPVPGGDGGSAVHGEGTGDRRGGGRSLYLHHAGGGGTEIIVPRDRDIDIPELRIAVSVVIGDEVVIDRRAGCRGIGEGLEAHSVDESHRRVLPAWPAAVQLRVAPDIEGEVTAPPGLVVDIETEGVRPCDREGEKRQEQE